MSLIESICKNIYPLDTRFMEQAQARQDRLIKPQGSLGKLEEISIQLAGIYGSKYFDTTKKIVLSFACDHGVYEEGVAPNNQNITLLQSMNFPKKINGVGTISKFVGSDVQLIDVGINCDEPIEGVIDCKIRKSTSNMAKGPAMTRQEAIRAIEIGIEMSEKYIQEDYKVIGIGEMGIANTTPSAAIISVIAGCDPQEVTGMGAGLKKELLQHKAQVIRTAIEINQPNPTDGQYHFPGSCADTCIFRPGKYLAWTALSPKRRSDPVEGNGKSGSEKRGRTWDPFRPEEIHFPDDSGTEEMRGNSEGHDERL